METNPKFDATAWAPIKKLASCTRSAQFGQISVIDLFSRRIVGWFMDKRMKAKLLNDALLMTIWKPKPVKELVWHTDRGNQCTSDSHREILKQHEIEKSMSRKCDCLDDAVSKGFFHMKMTPLEI